jgi:hypothetical protein
VRDGREKRTVSEPLGCVGGFVIPLQGRLVQSNLSAFWARDGHLVSGRLRQMTVGVNREIKR